MLEQLKREESSAPDVSSPLNLLIVEDSPEDVELIVLTLSAAEIIFTYDIAETAAVCQQRLQEYTYSAVLSDYRLPGFNGLQALKLLQQSGQEIPFILVTGNFGEEVAVKCIKAGMTDYVLKDRLFRLPTVLSRALQEFDLRRTQEHEMAERKRAEIALRKSEQRFRALIENATDIILILNVQSQFRYISPSVTSILGYAPISLIGQNFFELVHSEERQQIIDFFELVQENPGISHRVGKYRLRTCQDTWSILEVVATNLRDDPAVAGIVVNCHDITERHKAEEQLRYDAHHDKLTGLANRTYLLKQLKQLIRKKQRRQEDQFALLFLDINRFKVVNDSLGHLIGDQLLIEIARRLEQCHRDRDVLARFGGDEFVILLENIRNINEPLKVAKRIHQALSHSFFLDNCEFFISASIGITLSSESYNQPEQMLRDADIAMYRAKARGQAQHEIFDPEMHLYALKQLHLESDLRQAIQRQELVVYYQPIISLETNSIAGVEALVRWQPPNKKMVLPNDFIPLAEETGLIISLDRWVLRSACHQFRLWQQQFSSFAPKFVSVNLSGKQFSQADLLEQIDLILSETGLEGQYLKLEITESVLIENPETAVEIFEQLQRRNIQVCLDDFGTGYSSLSYLHRFPLRILKIDRSFVSHLEETEKNGVIVRMMATLAHELGIELIAEGIESVYQMNFLKTLGYQLGQGYWFSPPVDSEALETLMNYLEVIP